MNYWIISPNVTNNKGEENQWKEAILKFNRAIMGWGITDAFGITFANKVQKGDIILVAQGANWQKKLLLAGEVSSDVLNEHLPDTVRAALSRQLSFTIDAEELNALGLDFNGAAFGGSSQIPAIYQLKPWQNKADETIAGLLRNSIKKAKNRYKMNILKDVLTYKKQVILQGPPGTGKTWQALRLAEEMTRGENLGSPKNVIDDYMKSFNASLEQVILKRNELGELLEEFQQKFKKEKLNELMLDKYAFGMGTNESFCWWLEYALYEFGQYTGFARKFLIYWSKERQIYVKSGFIKDIDSDDEAMKKLAEQLYNVANNQNLLEASRFLGKGFILKILNSYYPDLYFPISNEICINNALKLFGFDHSGLNFIDKNKKLQEIFLNKKGTLNSSITNLELMEFLFSKYDMKGTIELQKDEVVSKGEFEIVQFHPAYTYEDFVRGMMAISNKNSQIEYVVENKILADFASRALNNNNANYVLILDEINRANLPSVLGELIFALEYRFDEEHPKLTTVQSMYALKENQDDEDGDKQLRLPNNLFIIGTMNTADRSVGHIDYAIRRRFAFIDILPSEEVINNVVPELLKDRAKVLFNNVSQLFIRELISPDFEPKDVQIGHSYFLATTENELKIKLDYEIKPILREYLRDGIFNITMNVNDYSIENYINNLSF